MTVNFIAGFVAAAVVLQILRVVFNSWQHSRKAQQLGCSKPPSYPCKDPIGIGNLRDVLAADKTKAVPLVWERRMKVMTNQKGRYVPTFILRMMGNDNIFTVDPKNVQAVLATQFKDFELGIVRRRIALQLLGTGIFTADGKEWSHSRALLRPQFTRDQVSQLDLEEGHVQKAMQALPVAADGWTATTNIQAIFFRLTMDSATEFLFGESAESQLGALNNQNRLEDSFAYYFDKSQWFAARRARFENMAFLVDSKETRISDKKVHDFVDKVVAEALRASENGKPAEHEKSSYVFLEALLATTRDPIELRSQLLNILLAGRDTTASLLSWTVMLLAAHPHEFHKLRQTILETFGTYSSPRNITFAALKSCQPLQHCMNESLRVYPVVPFNRRVATRDTTLPRGGGEDGESPVYVRKGQSVMYSVHVMHRRKDIWGPDADEFKPERWVNRKPGWEYVPFNGGPRICIGQQFALTEAGYVLVRLLQRFDQIEDVNAGQFAGWGLAMTSSPANPITVRMHEAADA
ncbi:hypothetical protein N7492_005098 [Penicillium capsulatum]|uniref:Cytochrome P450 n=1 Tax=Penicillium capsulatum TaxID=69766 RepID=A0A9W9IBN8_9EURO|nr:hypothetical protein N7492_005098 [Penicillium capsulatum]KAJ6135795.1 hypothetical protein N7512_000955 [Penicillium capsulatum]